MERSGGSKARKRNSTSLVSMLFPAIASEEKKNKRPVACLFFKHIHNHPLWLFFFCTLWVDIMFYSEMILPQVHLRNM